MEGINNKLWYMSQNTLIPRAVFIDIFPGWGNFEVRLYDELETVTSQREEREHRLHGKVLNQQNFSFNFRLERRKN